MEVKTNRIVLINHTLYFSGFQSLYATVTIVI